MYADAIIKDLYQDMLHILSVKGQFKLADSE
jgi:hypothetical protein